MHSVRVIPDVEDAPDALLSSGHLWLQELVDGHTLRFQMQDTGLLRFGDRDRVFPVDDIPLPYRHAVRHVRTELDRDALRDAVNEPTAVTFVTVATTRRSVAYDWDRLPPVLGVDIWSDTHDRFLSPDAVDGIYTGLGLAPVNTFDREVRAVDFDPGRYEIPASAWYDGPAFGVVIRDKTGHVATLGGDATDDTEPFDGTPVDLVDEHLEAITAHIETDIPVDDRIDRVLEELARRTAPELAHPATTFSVEDVRREIATRLTRHDTPQ